MTGTKVWDGSAWLDLDAWSHLDPLTTDGVATASSSRATISCTAHATPHTEGTWVEVDPSLSVDSAGVWFLLTAATNAAGGDSSTLLQIGTGASGSETVWATVGVGYRDLGAAGGSHPFYVPGKVTAGTRVAVRCRSVTTLKVVAAVYGFVAEHSTTTVGAPNVLQADTATSRGLTITAPGGLNAKGNWTALSTSTPARFSVLSLFPQAAAAATMNASGVLIDIGTGGAGSETVIIPDIYLLGSTSELWSPRSPLVYRVDIPAGTRLSARYARANAGNALDLIAVGA